MAACGLRHAAPASVASVGPALSRRAVRQPARATLSTNGRAVPHAGQSASARGASARTRVALKEAEAKVVAEDAEEESAFQPTESGPEPPNSFEVQNLLMELCDETDIAELKIKVGSFSLHVKRDFGHKASSAPAPTFYAPPVPSAPMVESIAASGGAAAPRAADPAPAEDVDEGLLYVLSPTVGILRRGRLLKGKKGRNLVEVGSEVKRGQVVCYVEQLGTQLAVESEHSGEVVSFSLDDGDAVGFGDPIVSVRPSFPGIKKLA